MTLQDNRVSSVEVNGGRVVYEILGDSGDLIVLTPGGRFGKDIPGLRPLALALVDGGYRVLLWDRPNCGASDVQFYGQSESHMRAETLHGLRPPSESSSASSPAAPAGRGIPSWPPFFFPSWSAN